MIIDFHTHVFPEKIASATIGALARKSNNKPNTDGTVNGMIEALKRANADIAEIKEIVDKKLELYFSRIDDDVWFPSLSEYNPGISKEKWIEHRGFFCKFTLIFQQVFI